MTLSEQQIKIAIKLLDLLCKTKQLDAKQAYSFFDSKSDAEYVCTVLKKRQLLIATFVGENDICALTVNENTCNAIKLLKKELKKDKKSVLLTNLTLISLIVSVVLNIGLIGNRFLKSDDSSKLKANLDTCMIRESNLNHVVDSLSLQNRNLQDKAIKLETEIVKLKQKDQN